MGANGRTITINQNGTVDLQTQYEQYTTTLNINGGILTGSTGQFRSAGSLTSTGGGDVTWTGAGYLELAGNVAYNAGAPNEALIFTGGELRLGAATRTFTVANDLQAIDVDVAATVTGTSVGITKEGLGVLALSANNSYSGPTVVNAGTLALKGSGAIGTSAVTVNAGTLAPGGIGTADAVNALGSTLTLTGSSTVHFDLGTISSDQIQVAGALTLDGALTVDDLGGLSPGTYTIMTYASTLAGAFSAINMPIGFTGIVNAGGGVVELVVSGSVTTTTSTTSTISTTTTSTTTTSTTSTTAAPVPALTVTTPVGKSIAFGDQLVGTTSGSQTITVQNNGTADATVTPTKSGANTGDFTVSGGTKTITQGGGSQSWTVTFGTSEYGARSASINFAAVEGGTPDSCAVSGNGTVADPGPNSYIWVDPNKASGGAGTYANPYASLEAAYASVWSTAGDHTIMLLPGTCDGANIGTSGFIDWFSLSAPAYNSVTLTAYMPTYTTIAFNPVGTGTTYYDALGAAMYGLWRPGNFDTGNLIVQDLTITVASGGVLIGNNSRSTSIVKFDFQNVDVYLNNGANGVSALFANDCTPTFLDQCSIQFSDSDLYWGTTEVFVGRTWGTGATGYTFPEAFVDGNTSSRVYVWNGSAYVQKTSLIGDTSVVWQGARNIGGSTIRHRENGDTTTIFLKNFLPCPLLAVTVPVGKSINFGDQPVGVESGSQTITVQNNGDVAATVTPVKSGLNAADFTVTGGQQVISSGGGSQSWTVTFTPGALGPSSASIDFAADEGGTGDSCAVSGNGVTTTTTTTTTTTSSTSTTTSSTSTTTTSTTTSTTSSSTTTTAPAGLDDTTVIKFQ